MSRLGLLSSLLLALLASALFGLTTRGQGLALILSPDLAWDGGSIPVPEPPGGDVVNTHYVIIAVQDGARYADTFGDPTYSNISRMGQGLGPQGTLLTRFYNKGLASTNPGHASLITGTDQRLDNSGLLRPDKPTLFEYHRRHEGSGPGDVWVVSGKTKLSILSHSRDGEARGASVSAFTGEDDQVWQEVQRVMDDHQPSIIVANFPSTDKRGHEGDWDGYIGAIRNFDRIAFELWNKIQTSPRYTDKTTLILTNDHGRSDLDWREHGDNTEGSRHVMFLALGPGAKKGFVSDRERNLADIVPTVGRLMSCPVPEARGEVMDELLETRVPAGVGAPP